MIKTLLIIIFTFLLIGDGKAQTNISSKEYKNQLGIGFGFSKYHFSSGNSFNDLLFKSTGGFNYLLNYDRAIANRLLIGCQLMRTSFFSVEASVGASRGYMIDPSLKIGYNLINPQGEHSAIQLYCVLAAGPSFLNIYRNKSVANYEAIGSSAAFSLEFRTSWRRIFLAYHLSVFAYSYSNQPYTDSKGDDYFNSLKASGNRMEMVVGFKF